MVLIPVLRNSWVRQPRQDSRAGTGIVRWKNRFPHRKNTYVRICILRQNVFNCGRPPQAGWSRRKKGNGIEPYPKTDSGVRDIDLAPALAALVKDFSGNRKSGFLFGTANGLPLSPRNITRDSLHAILKKMGRESAGFHPFRRFRGSILQRSEARTLLIDYWMGHANGEMSGRYGKQLLENVVWRQECAAKVGFGFTLSVPEAEDQSQIVGQVVGQVGQVLRVAEQQAIAL